MAIRRFVVCELPFICGALICTQKARGQPTDFLWLRVQLGEVKRTLKAIPCDYRGISETLVVGFPPQWAYSPFTSRWVLLCRLFEFPLIGF